jgi:hypothetical protein
MDQTNILNFILALIIILLIFKLIFYNHEYEHFNSDSYILNCRKYPYLCNDNNSNQTQNQNGSLYVTKRPEYLSNVLDKFSPRYDPSSRNMRNNRNNRNNRNMRNMRNNRNNRNNTFDSTVFTRRRFFDPQANVR